MVGLPIKRTIKYQAELDPHFVEEIAATPGGENLRSCIQCGTCSSTCPVSIYMDYTPRRIIGMTRAGFKQDVLASNTIWLCASCYACTVDCPKQVKITEVMYALKQKAIAEKVYPRWLPIPALAREFYRSVFKHGRMNEGLLVARVFLRTNPLRILAQAGMGLRLWMRGRMSMKQERLTPAPGGKGDLKTLLQNIDTIARRGRHGQPATAEVTQ